MRHLAHLLLALILTSVWFDANAHETCRIKTEQIEFFEDTNTGVITRQFVDEGAACLMSESILLSDACSSLTPGDASSLCENPTEHTRIITMVHPQKGYLQCAVSRKDHTQAIRCIELNYK